MKLNKIREVLEERGISQSWLSKRLGKAVHGSTPMSVTEPNLVWMFCYRLQPSCRLI